MKLDTETKSAIKASFDRLGGVRRRASKCRGDAPALSDLERLYRAAPISLAGKRPANIDRMLSGGVTVFAVLAEAGLIRYPLPR